MTVESPKSKKINMSGSTGKKKYKQASIASFFKKRENPPTITQPESAAAVEVSSTAQEKPDESKLPLSKENDAKDSSMLVSACSSQDAENKRLEEQLDKDEKSETTMSVSYTHLDVYKRQ